MNFKKKYDFPLTLHTLLQETIPLRTIKKLKNLFFVNITTHPINFVTHPVGCLQTLLWNVYLPAKSKMVWRELFIMICQPCPPYRPLSWDPPYRPLSSPTSIFCLSLLLSFVLLKSSLYSILPSHLNVFFQYYTNVWMFYAKKCLILSFVVICIQYSFPPLSIVKKTFGSLSWYDLSFFHCSSYAYSNIFYSIVLLLIYLVFLSLGFVILY